MTKQLDQPNLNLIEQSIAAFRVRADTWEREQGELGKIVASELRVVINCFDEMLIWKCEHEWKYISDWAGDPGGIGGTYDCSRWECQLCGETDDKREPP